MGALGFELAPGRWRAPGAGAGGFDFTGGALPAGATLTRASAGSRFDASGTLVAAAADAARFDHDPVTLGLRGLLIEPAASNLLLRSAGFDDPAVWPRAAVATAADQAAAPDGTNAADLVTITATGHFLKQSAAVAAGAAYTWSFWARRGTATALAMGVYDNNSGGWIVPAQSYLAQTVADGWRRVALGFTTPAGCTSLAVYPTLNGSSTGTVLLWGAQLEAGAQATTPIATAAASASRAADALTLNWGAQGVADGPLTVRYTFDDGSTQDVATTVAGGTASVPTTLARRWLRRADKL